MKIGELDNHCGKCPLIDYCTDPYETPQICSMDEFVDVDAETYKEIAETITESEIKAKQKEYESQSFQWSDNLRGAICDIVRERISKDT